MKAKRSNPLNRHNAQLFVEKLGLNPLGRRHAIPCPFHPDTEPSMSIDLKEGIFFCHGACDEPKGGGVVLFLVKWLRFREAKTVSMRDARKMLTQTFSVPDVVELQREMMREKVLLFARTCNAAAGRMLRATDRPLLTGHEPTEAEWDTLALIAAERTRYEYEWEHTRPHHDGTLTPRMIALYQESVAASLWTPDDEMEARESLTRAQEWLESPEYQEFKTYAWQQRHLESQRYREEMETRCRAKLSPARIPRTPMPIRTPLPR